MPTNLAGRQARYWRTSATETIGALSQAKGQEKWNVSKPLAWGDEVKRFFATLRALDDYLASDSALGLRPNGFFKERSRTR